MQACRRRRAQPRRSVTPPAPGANAKTSAASTKVRPFANSQIAWKCRPFTGSAAERNRSSNSAMLICPAIVAMISLPNHGKRR